MECEDEQKQQTHKTTQEGRESTGTYISGRAHVDIMSDLLGDHAQLLKVHKAIHIGVVAKVDKSQVFLHHREDRNLAKGT